MKLLSAFILLCLASPAYAEVESLPTEEQAFLDVIPSLPPQKIVELLGEPDQLIVLHGQDDEEEIGAIVHYRYINTNSEGEYYKTTELDYAGGRLVMVVFSNSDFENAKTAALPPAEAECPIAC